MKKIIHLITSLQYGGTEKFLNTLISIDNNKNHKLISLKKKSKNDIRLKKNIKIIYLNFSYNFNLTLKFDFLHQLIRNIKVPVNTLRIIIIIKDSE